MGLLGNMLLEIVHALMVANSEHACIFVLFSGLASRC